MPIITKANDDIVTIQVVGAFDYKMRPEFCRAYINQPADMFFVIDCSEVTYVDSSALGMLLELRERCEEKQTKISIIHCKPEIGKLIQIAQFLDFGHNNVGKWQNMSDFYQIQDTPCASLPGENSCQKS